VEGKILYGEPRPPGQGEGDAFPGHDPVIVVRLRKLGDERPPVGSAYGGLGASAAEGGAGRKQELEFVAYVLVLEKSLGKPEQQRQFDKGRDAAGAWFG
jgi:hypothetical protein